MSPRLFFYIAGVEARRRMSYRADFWLSIILGFAARFGVVYFLWTAMFRESGAASIGGYSLDGMLVYYFAVLLISQIVIGVSFESEVATDIYEGALNRYLLFPSSYFWFKYAQRVGSLLPVLLQLVLFGGIFLMFFELPTDTNVSAASVVMSCGSLAIAHLLFYTMIFPLQSVAFWADNVWSLMVSLRFVTSLLGGLMFPLALFPDWIQTLNAWLPFPVLFAAPTEALLGRIPFSEWLASSGLGLGWCLAIGLLDRAVWRRGSLHYSGVGI